jgi:CMP-N-acetylneuraminic acid synthetase
MNIAMIPARMSSQRLKKKNLRELSGVPLIIRAIRKCKAAGIFDEIWVNSEHPVFGEIASKEKVKFHKRPKKLADNKATSEAYVYDFLKAHSCQYLFQVHTIAPLVTAKDIKNFVNCMLKNNYDVLLSVVNEQIECIFKGKPVNFTFNRKTNSQELIPVQRLTWAITGWKRSGYIKAYEKKKCATYSGKIGCYPMNRSAGHIIKTAEDLKIAQALLNIKGS